jgi:hypothetical protein
VNPVTDGQGQYRRNSYMTLGLAVGCGLLLAGWLAGPRSRRSDTLPARPQVSGRAPSEQVLLMRAPSERYQPVLDWINIAVAGYRVADSLYRVLTPVFRYRKSRSVADSVAPR